MRDLLILFPELVLTGAALVLIVAARRVARAGVAAGLVIAAAVFDNRMRTPASEYIRCPVITAFSPGTGRRIISIGCAPTVISGSSSCFAPVRPLRMLPW